MGAASSGGSDNQVSGAEAVYTGGTTYSSRQTKTVNKSIADQNRKNRESRKSPITKLFEASLIGKGAKAISNSKFVRENNLKRRKDFATKKGLKISGMSDDFILSSGFKTQLDGLGYSDEPGNVGGRGDDNQPVIVKKNIGGTTVQTTEAKLAEEKADSKESSYDVRKTKRKGRRLTILTSSSGASGNLILGKPTLLGA